MSPSARHGRLARGDRRRQRLLRRDPAFALRLAGHRGEPFGLVRGRLERGVAAMRLADERGQPGGQRRVDRPVVHRPHDRHARIDRFGGARQQRRRRIAGGATGEQQKREKDGRAHRANLYGRQAS